MIRSFDWINDSPGGRIGLTQTLIPAREMHTRKRDLMKTLSFAALHFGVAFTVAYALTGSVTIAAGIGLIEPLANTVAFYFHERAWRRLDGREPSRGRVPVPCCGMLKAG
jgi:uncharacterized membrane protein